VIFVVVITCSRHNLQFSTTKKIFLLLRDSIFSICWPKVTLIHVLLRLLLPKEINELLLSHDPIQMLYLKKKITIHQCTKLSSKCIANLWEFCIHMQHDEREYFSQLSDQIRARSILQKPRANYIIIIIFGKIF